jgi:chromosome segregation protein
LYLKKLELYGFKSFANKTILTFEPGVTAVVGPNGCGKSNVSDSIKWVLGEQSAKELRGLKMEDVIFNGTDSAQPVNLAEVSLTFSNKDRILPIDYDEVIITRRVYRSGESEYLLNKTQVRLKDINALLAGTGIGVSSYSIAEQGKMDRVLHSKPEDRREIFEEASGITKYKARRKEALNKLESTENNLIRIADIVNEIKRQINSIERQAQKAERFRVEFEKMKELDIKLALHEYSSIKAKESEKKQNVVSLKQKEGQLSLELGLQQDELRLYREKTSALDSSISEKKQSLSGMLANVDKNENSVRVNKERIEELNVRCESLSRELDEISARSSGISDKIASMESEFGMISAEREKKQLYIKQTEENLSTITAVIKQCESAISEAKVSIMENASSQSRMRNEISKISADLSTASSRHRRLGIEDDKIVNDIEQASLILQSAEASYAEQRKVLENVLQLLHSLKNAHTQLTINFKEKTDLMDKLRQRLASSSSKLEMLKDLKQKREGLSEGVKAYMEFIEKDPVQKELFVGIVADVIKAKDALIKPLEAALGEMSQAIIVENIFARQKAVEFLKSSKSGRAHFIVLNNTSAVEGECPDNTDRAGHSGFIGSLFEMIDVKQGCEQVIGRLLKDVYLVERSELENGIARPETTLISKDGDTRRGIVFSGGYNSCDEYTSIIGRDAKIKELAHDVEGLRSQISEYEQEHSRMAFRLEQMKKDVSGQEDISKREEIKLNSIDAQRLKISEQIDRLQEELKLIRLELEETIEEESSLKLREESLSAQYKELEEKQQELDILISNNQQEISQKTSEKEEAIALLAEIRTEMSLVSEKYESQNATLSMLKGALENEKISASDRKIQAQQARSRSESLQSDIEALVKSNEDLRAEIDGINGTLLKLQEERKSIYILVEQFENKTRDMQKELDELRSSISNSHINASELSYTLSSIKERVESSYRIDIENEGVVFNGIEDFSSMSEELTCLKEKIERMGPVNLVAIDEHKELKERYDFLSTQQQDLVDAKESLHKAINKINRTTRKMFIETFDAIKVAFKEYFKLLFGGGTAELFLMDQSDILESGIEIIVRPPGKKLQSISLLSGGEKALTSVALLFALFKVRPTPFCILDEIDAPLDEANIDRFSRMLEEFIHSTQFIVITHNKKTISASDVMYGITMEKSGISKIVSVKLADDERIQRRRKLAEIEGVSRLKDVSREPEEESGVVEPVTENK